MSALIAELGQAKKKKRPSMSNGSPAVVKVVKVAPVPDSTLQDLALFIDDPEHDTTRPLVVRERFVARPPLRPDETNVLPAIAATPSATRSMFCRTVSN